MKNIRICSVLAAAVLCAAVSLTSCGLKKAASPLPQSSSASSLSQPVSSRSSDSGKASVPYPFDGISDTTIKNPKTYTHKTFKFSVQYPAGWKAEEEVYHKATASKEADPDVVSTCIRTVTSQIVCSLTAAL